MKQVKEVSKDVDKFKESLTHPDLPKMTLEKFMTTDKAVIDFVTK